VTDRGTPPQKKSDVGKGTDDEVPKILKCLEGLKGGGKGKVFLKQGVLRTPGPDHREGSFSERGAIKFQREKKTSSPKKRGFKAGESRPSRKKRGHTRRSLRDWEGADTEYRRQNP